MSRYLSNTHEQYNVGWKYNTDNPHTYISREATKISKKATNKNKNKIITLPFLLAMIKFRVYDQKCLGFWWEEWKIMCVMNGWEDFKVVVGIGVNKF